MSRICIVSTLASATPPRANPGFMAGIDNFSSRTLLPGEPLPVTGKLLRHGEIECTERYAHLADESVKESGSLAGNRIRLHIAPIHPTQPDLSR